MPSLFMVLMGATVPGRHTEQHDVFFGIGASMTSIIPALQASWPDAGTKLHVDAWREITHVNGYRITIIPNRNNTLPIGPRLFFLNLGGYKAGEFEEFHYKMIIAANDKGDAITQAKATAFYKHTGFKGATSHIDDKYGVDVDDLYEIADILDPTSRAHYSIVLEEAAPGPSEDELHLGYFKLSSFQ